MQTQLRRRLAVAGALVAALGAVGGAGAAGGGGTIASPGFPNGTWIGTGVISSPTETVAGLTTRSSGKVSFTLTVSGGKVTGSGNWSYTQVGTGDIASRMVGVAPIRFSGTPTKPAFAGTMRITGEFVGYGKVRHSNSFTKPLAGALVVKKAGSCKVTGGHTNAASGTTVAWTALLKGVTCVS